jgi:hypothetical protein
MCNCSAPEISILLPTLPPSQPHETLSLLTIMSASLAPELLDTIVKQVEGTAALLVPSQRRLFSKVCLVAESSQIPVYWGHARLAPCFTTFHSFLALLTRSPHLGSYVTDLSLHVH